MERRLTTLEQRLGPTPDPGRLVTVSPNSWSDADRDAWQRAEVLRDVDGKDDLIERNTGIRLTRGPGLVSVVIVPAPQSIEDADEATRSEWRARRASWKSD